MTRQPLVRALPACLAVLAALAGCAPAPPAGGTLQISARSSAGDFAQVFWDEGRGYNEAQSQRVPLERTPNGFQALRFAIPDGDIRGVRLDPFNGPGDFDVASIEVLDPDGRAIRTLDAQSLMPLAGIASVTRASGATHIVTAGADPYLLISPPCLAAPPGNWSLTAVTPLGLALATLAALAVLGTAAWTTLRPARRLQLLVTQAAGRGDVLPWLWLASLFLVIVAAKLWLIGTHPARVPYVDQWTAEAGGLYLPWQDHCLSWRQMFAAHNEHRIFFTRLLALGLFVVNRQWDPQLQQVVNAFVHAFTAVALALFFWRQFGRRRLDVIVVLCALAFALPFSWENTLAGFQSAFYFTVLFTVLALGLTMQPAPGGAWTVGWLCAACGLVSSAGGLLTPLAIAAATALRAVGGRLDRRAVVADAALVGLLVGLSLVLRPPDLAQHAALRAGGAAELIAALGRNLAWPWIERPAMAFVVWLPGLALAGLMVLRRSRPTDGEALIGGLGAWVVLQAVALAFARGAGGAPPASRYMDMLSLGCFANAMALVRLMERRTSAGWRRPLGWAAVAGWVLVCGVGLDRLLVEMQRGADVRRTWMEDYTRTIKDFLRTDDLDGLTAKRFPFETPFYDARLLANAWLRNPAIRRVLPAGIREPLRLEPEDGAAPAFAEHGWYPTTPAAPRAARGSFIGAGNPTEGRFVSRPIRCISGGYLSFELAGYLGVPGTSLALVHGAETASIRTGGPAGEAWVEAAVRCPDTRFEVVATDGTPEYWFAFSDPIEVGPLSAGADTLVGHAQGLLIAALALAAFTARLS